MFVFAVNMSVCVVGRPLSTAQSGCPHPSTHPHDPTNSVPPHPPHPSRKKNPRHNRGGGMVAPQEKRRGHVCGQLCHGDRCCNCQLMDHLSGTSLGFFWWPGPLESGEGSTSNRWEKMELAQTGMDERLGHIYQPFDCSHGD